MRETAEQDKDADTDENKRPEKLCKTDVKIKNARHKEKPTYEHQDDPGDPAFTSDKADYPNDN